MSAARSSAPRTSSRTDDDGGAWQVGGAEGGWWALERAELIGERLRPLLPTAGVVVDIGCGRGETVELLCDAGAQFVVGCDFTRFPQWQPRAGRSAHVVCHIAHLPLRPASAGLATAFDVVEHFADDRDPLRSARAVLGEGGRLALTVPALPSLWSPFDERVGHHRRYTRQTIEAAARSAGFEPQDTTYFFSWLVPAAWVMKRRDRAEADAVHPGLLGRAMYSVIGAICAAERFVLRRRRLPFGTSLWSLCRPEDERR